MSRLALSVVDKGVFARVQRDLHAVSVEKGFWDGQDPPSVNDQLAKLMLITTEVAEVAEEVRTGPLVTRYYDPTRGPGLGKPEGLGPELADVFIRLCDFAEAVGVNLIEEVQIKDEFNRTRERMHGKLA